MSIYDWANHADKIEALREQTLDELQADGTIAKALQWAVANDVAELPELVEALSVSFLSGGYEGQPANRAMNILLDAYFEEQNND